MTIELTKTYKETKNIPVPSFWKEPNMVNIHSYIALLDEQTAVAVILMDDYSSIRNCSPSYLKDEIQKAYSSYDLCSEEQFLSAYDEALQGMTLKPIERIDTGAGEAYNNLKHQINY